MDNKRIIRKPHPKARRSYVGRRIRALIAAGLVFLSVGTAVKKGIDIHEANSAQETLQKQELSIDNNVPGRAELGSIIMEFNEQNPNMEDDFMEYLEAQKNLFNKKELSVAKEKVNSYKESIEQLDTDISTVTSKYMASDESDKTENLDNPMAIIDKYNNILKELDDYDNSMPTEINALKLELQNELKSVRDKDSILRDIKSRYIAKYNENENTKLTTSDIKLAVRPQDYVIQTQSGKYITHGNYPDKIASFLGNQTTKSVSNVNVYAAYNNDKLIESVARVNGHIYSIYDGNNPKSLYENKDNKTLKEFIHVIDSGLTWYQSPDDSYAKQKYIDALANLYSKENIKQVKDLDEIDGERT